MKRTRREHNGVGFTEVSSSEETSELLGEVAQSAMTKAFFAEVTYHRFQFARNCLAACCCLQ